MNNKLYKLKSAPHVILADREDGFASVVWSESNRYDHIEGFLYVFNLDNLIELTPEEAEYYMERIELFDTA